MMDSTEVKKPMKPGVAGAGGFDEDPFAQYQLQGGNQPNRQLDQPFEFGGQKPAQYSAAGTGRSFPGDPQAGQVRAGGTVNAAALQNFAVNNPELLAAYEDYRRGNPKALDRLGNVDKGKLIADLMEAKDDPRKLEEMALLDKDSFNKRYAAEGEQE